MKGMQYLGGTMLLMAGLLVPTVAGAALQYFTQDDVMRVSGKYAEGDLDALKAHLVPEVKTVVLGNISGGSWEQGRDLGQLIERAGVSTVVHGNCSGWVCSMMFLSGRQRMFSGVGRREMHFVVIPFIEGKANYTWNGIAEPLIPDWLHAHSRLSYADLQIETHALLMSRNGVVVDSYVFFPPDAGFSKGDVLRCSGETAIEQGKNFLVPADCAPVKDATALGKGIITTTDTYVDASLDVKADAPVPAASGYAGLGEDMDVGVAQNNDCKLVYAKFLRYDSPRALVVNDRGGCYASSAQVKRPYSQAMEACRGEKGKCRYYAVDDAVVFVPFGKALPKKGKAQARADNP